MEHTKGIMQVNEKSEVLEISGETIAFTVSRYKSDEVEVRQDGESWLDMRRRTEPQREKAGRERIANNHRISKCWNMHDDFVHALSEARNQIEYLHEKFQETGSGNTVISRIEQLLQRAE